MCEALHYVSEALYCGLCLPYPMAFGGKLTGCDGQPTLDDHCAKVTADRQLLCRDLGVPESKTF